MGSPGLGSPRRVGVRLGDLESFLSRAVARVGERAVLARPLLELFVEVERLVEPIAERVVDQERTV